MWKSTAIVGYLAACVATWAATQGLLDWDSWARMVAVVVMSTAVVEIFAKPKCKEDDHD